MWTRELFKFSVVLGSQSLKSGAKERGSQKELLLLSRVQGALTVSPGFCDGSSGIPAAATSLSSGSPQLDS